MADYMDFPATVEEFMEQYKITDTEEVYTNGIELVPIFRMKQWFDHYSLADVVQVVYGHWVKTADGAECDNCGREAVYQIIDGRWQYEPWCPHCGAKMDAQGEG